MSAGQMSERWRYTLDFGGSFPKAVQNDVKFYTSRRNLRVLVCSPPPTPILENTVLENILLVTDLGAKWITFHWCFDLHFLMKHSRIFIYASWAFLLSCDKCAPVPGSSVGARNTLMSKATHLSSSTLPSIRHVQNTVVKYYRDHGRSLRTPWQSREACGQVSQRGTWLQVTRARKS